RQLGSPPPATAYADAVPEPGSAALLSAALLSVLAQVRRLHRSSPMN
ncbi:MAG: PEP-CTERM sorting domain-containing protein, partial [Pirellulales bacterium]|nr:PEP-CTERM sorting domain-containing protein [Pirellulales bacterium]